MYAVHHRVVELQSRTATQDIGVCFGWPQGVYLVLGGLLQLQDTSNLNSLVLVAGGLARLGRTIDKQTGFFHSQDGVVVVQQPHSWIDLHP